MTIKNRFSEKLTIFSEDSTCSKKWISFFLTFRYNEEEWKLNNGLLTDVTFENLCKKSPLQDQLVWLEPVSYDVLSEYCQKVKG